MASRREKKGAVFPMLIVMIGVLVVLIILAIAFLPFQIASFSETRDVPAQSGFTTAVLNITSDVGSIRIAYPDGGPPNGNLVEMQLSATTSSGLLPSQSISDVLNVTFYYTIVEKTLYVTVDVVSSAGGNPFPGTVQNLSIVILVDPSLEGSIYARTITGNIQMVSSEGVKIDSLGLSTTTGHVEANATGNTFDGNIDLRTTTGDSTLIWDNAKAGGNVSVNMGTTTGTGNLDLAQFNALGGIVTITASSVTGIVSMNMDLKDGVGAMVNSQVTTGTITVSRQTGFTGANNSLRSMNYPATGNFIINLSTNLGGVNLDAVYQP